jgi:hypothetical protein
MLTLFVIVVVVWTVIRIMQLASRLWRSVDDSDTSRIGAVTSQQ